MESVMKKILIIEDSITIMKALTVLLENKGFETLSAENGELGVELAMNGHPDLIVLDTVLPGIDGFEVCRTIKLRLQDKAPKIIVMTGDIRAVNSAQAREAGADEYVAKTSDFSSLFSAINKLI
jgi:DNA-binding response OmpR family regulator